MLYSTFYKAENNSKKWITFIHGAGGNSSIWYNQVRFFKAYFNIMLIDLRGHGKSKIPLEESDRICIPLVYQLELQQEFYSHHLPVTHHQVCQ